MKNVVIPHYHFPLPGCHFSLFDLEEEVTSPYFLGLVWPLAIMCFPHFSLISASLGWKPEIMFEWREVIMPGCDVCQACLSWQQLNGIVWRHKLFMAAFCFVILYEYGWLFLKLIMNSIDHYHPKSFNLGLIMESQVNTAGDNQNPISQFLTTNLKHSIRPSTMTMLQWLDNFKV